VVSTLASAAGAFREHRGSGNTAPSAEIRYQITDLGTLGGSRSFATGLNDRGEVVGYSEIEFGVFQFHAFRWKDGHMQDLGTLGGDQSFALSINRRGQVVGSAYTDTQASHAVLWKNGTIRDLGLLPRGSSTFARGINDRGEVIGSGDTFVANRFGYFEVSRAFLWKNGRMRLLDDLDPRAGPEEGSNLAVAINNRGVVVGDAERIRNQPTWPVLWQAGGSHRIRPLVPSEGTVYAVNDLGQVVGQV